MVDPSDIEHELPGSTGWQNARICIFRALSSGRVLIERFDGLSARMSSSARRLRHVGSSARRLGNKQVRTGTNDINGKLTAAGHLVHTTRGVIMEMMTGKDVGSAWRNLAGTTLPRNGSV